MVVLTTFTQPTEGIRQRQPNTTAYVNDNNLGKGTLYVAESCLSWISDSGNGFSIEYPNISLHAVSRDLSAFPHECLFLMLDIALGDEETKNGEENGDGDGSDDEQTTTELRFVPDDRGMLDAMFHAMNACQALHPDPEDSVSDEDIYEDVDDDIQMEETDSRMANLLIGTPLRTFLGNNHMEFQASGILPQRTVIGDSQGQGERDRYQERYSELVRVANIEHRHRVTDIEEDMEKPVGIVDLEGQEVDNNERGLEYNFGNSVQSVRPAHLRSNEQALLAQNSAVGVQTDSARLGRVQDGRSSHLGNSLHQGSLDVLPQVQSPHMASHFSDAES